MNKINKEQNRQFKISFVTLAHSFFNYHGQRFVQNTHEYSVPLKTVTFAA